MYTFTNTTNKFKKSFGFTLIELFISLSIAAILSLVGIPELSRTIQKNQSSNAISQLIGFYNMARSEAITRQNPVYLCGSNSGTTCDKEWTKYAIIFLDDDGNKKPSATEIVKMATLSLKNSYIKSRLAFGSNYIAISNQGRPKHLGSMIYCSNKNTKVFIGRITWNRTGRVYKGIDKNNDNIIDDINGQPLTC